MTTYELWIGSNLVEESAESPDDILCNVLEYLDAGDEDEVRTDFGFRALDSDGTTIEVLTGQALIDRARQVPDDVRVAIKARWAEPDEEDDE